MNYRNKLNEYARQVYAELEATNWSLSRKSEAIYMRALNTNGTRVKIRIAGHDGNHINMCPVVHIDSINADIETIKEAMDKAEHNRDGSAYCPVIVQ